MHIINNLKEISNSKIQFFTTPGHSQGFGINKDVLNLLGENVFKYDFSEVDGMDNLQNPEGIILESQIKAGEIYNSGASFYLVNGSSSGVLALTLSTLSEGDNVLVARNTHKSIINGLVLSGVKPIWLETEWDEFWNIPTIVSLDKIKEHLHYNPDIKAVFITNPTYEGVITDIKEISKYLKQKKIPLIVDEAHGALWNFHEDLPTPAILQGADASVQSLHKTASSLTQSAILHLSHDSLIDKEKVQQSLNTINTTSPSYILLASTEGCINYLASNKKNQGYDQIDKLLFNIDIFKEKLSKKLDIKFLEDTTSYTVDKTKLLISIAGISGFDLAEEMYEKSKIETELDNYTSTLAICGIGTTLEKLNKLSKALIKAQKVLKTQSKQDNFITPLVMPWTQMTPREAFFKNSELVPAHNAIGRIAKEIVVSYPPGIPVIIPGEEIRDEHLEHIRQDYISVIKD